jgi:SAM-dependent methyltransferase
MSVESPPPVPVSQRLKREQEFFDDLVVEGSDTRSVLHNLSTGFYDKGARGRLWAPVWNTVDFADKAVLDYGCGAGDFSYLLTRFGAKVTGIDVSPQLIERAQSDGSSNDGFPRFLVGDAHRTPFPNNSFDYVVGNGALHHLDLDRAYGEIARVLKPGGKAYFMEPMYSHPLLWLLRRLTPNAHTTDEKPLSISDMEAAKSWFRGVSHREHFVFSVLVAPVHLIDANVALTVISGVDRVDSMLMQAFPYLRRFAWLAMVALEK